MDLRALCTGPALHQRLPLRFPRHPLRIRPGTVSVYQAEGAADQTVTGCSAPALRQPQPVQPWEGQHQLVRSAAGELTHRASRRATLFAPGAGAPTKTITPGRGELKPVPPGTDEHQLVRSAAGELAHRASRRATLFAPGAGAPTKTITPGRGELKPVPPGRDEHQLVRGAAGALAHRASRRATLFAPGAGAPTRL